MNSHINGNYYSGGFAEIVQNPSELTYSFLKDWFSGAGSVGIAMKLLGLPCFLQNEPLLELIDGELLVNLKTEEKTLYRDTIFKYKIQSVFNKEPILEVNIGKLLNPRKWKGTLQIVIKQGQWIANPEKVLENAKEIVDSISVIKAGSNLLEVKETFKNGIWPNVIAVGLLSEFFNKFIDNEFKGEGTIARQYIAQELAGKDWFFRSYSDQFKVKAGQLSFENYIEEFGVRADKDYELTSPRWHEIPDVIQKRISLAKEFEKTNEITMPGNSKKQAGLIKTAIELQLLRSEAKRKALMAYDNLRQAFLAENMAMPEDKSRIKASTVHNVSVKSGKGMGISAGVVSGKVLQSDSLDIVIPEGSICIFPNASPEYSMLYTNCNGMIFLKGGQTSHGATVAREYGIPALVDEMASGLPFDSYVEINGSSGEWKIVEKKSIVQSEKQSTQNLSDTNDVNDEMQTVESHELLIPLEKVSKDNWWQVGGKAASLGELTKIGVPVPPGFALTTLAFKNFSQHRFDDALKVQILEQLKALNSRLVAVRSSAVGEDAKSASFAGQLESYLNVSNDELFEKIVECYKQFRNPKVTDYIRKHNLEADKFKMAVLIQKMVNSDVSGVLFTQNPVNKNDEYVIEAVSGLGEKLVQGDITPEKYVLKKVNGDVIEQSGSLLSSEQLTGLVEIARQIENHFKAPQDIEWAIENDEIFILQTRPITT